MKRLLKQFHPYTENTREVVAILHLYGYDCIDVCEQLGEDYITISESWKAYFTTQDTNNLAERLYLNQEQFIEYAVNLANSEEVQPIDLPF